MTRFAASMTGLLALLAACGSPAREPRASSLPHAGRFDWEHPVASLELGKHLLEISGLCTLDAHTVACVDDERGHLVILDLRTGATRDAKFGAHGDYEALARLGDELYVLRSDGRLFALAPGTPDWTTIASFGIGERGGEYESLAADPAHERLLFAKKHGKDQRHAVLAWNARRTTVEAEPVLVLSREHLIASAARMGFALPDEGLTLRISELALHPTRAELYVLSAQDRCVLVVDLHGELLDLHVFPEALLPQAEALAFLPDGDLLIASEGGHGPARLCRFRPNPPAETR